MDLKEIEVLGPDVGKHWYYTSKARAMRQFLGTHMPSTVLDVGAGSGFFSRFLLANPATREAWCVDPGYASEHDELESGKPIRFRRSIAQVDADLVLMMDVLEHVDDDVGVDGRCGSAHRRAVQLVVRHAVELQVAVVHHEC